jgi:hypothetical protein
MLKNSILLSTAALVVLTAASPVPAQGASGTPELPITRVVLYTSGVGYFQRDGEVNDQATVALHFSADQVNDLLKSLIVQDRAGGKFNLIEYDNRNPIDRTLKTFALDLTGDPSLGKLLTQARGERIQITLPQENAGNPLEGLIVGVEQKKEPAGKDQVIEIEQLNLLTDKGIISRPLARVERIEFAKPALRKDFRKALEVLATGRDRQKKTVALSFGGAGKRPVSVGYLVSSPVWKTSYRLSIDDGKVALQGWAIVENTTDDDWIGVRVGLVEGRPISFRMELYEPLFVPRPLVQLERFAGLVPQVHEGELASPLPPAAPSPLRDQAKAAKNGFGGFGAKEAESLEALGRAGGRRIDITKGAVAAAPVEAGESFRYEIKEPVSLARQKSALLPILNQTVEAQRVSIYNHGVQAKYAMRGLSLKNSSSLHLMQGPVTVLEESSYAGDALLPNIQPGEERLLSYAIDLGVEVAPTTDPKKPETEELVSVNISRGILHATYKQRQTQIYNITNRNEQARDIIIEHLKQAGWHVVPTKNEKAPKETRDVYRFAVSVPAHKSASLDVVQEKKRLDQVVLTNSPDDTLRVLISRTSQESIKKALGQAIALKAAWADTQRAITREREAVATIEKNQARLRENLKILEKTSDLFKTSMKRFEKQENELEERQARINQLQTVADQQRREYEAFISNLELD